MQKPRCVGSFYVPNPINYNVGYYNKNQYLMESEHKEFFFFNEMEDDHLNEAGERVMRTYVQVCLNK